MGPSHRPSLSVLAPKGAPTSGRSQSSAVQRDPQQEIRTTEEVTQVWAHPDILVSVAMRRGMFLMSVITEWGYHSAWNS